VTFIGKIIKKPIDLNSTTKELSISATKKGGGALVLFMGFVKGVVNNAEVTNLVYEAYEPYASKKLNEIAKDYSKMEGVLDVIILHRIGNLKPGEPTIYIFVTAVNRKLAFKVASEALERVKHEVPIFKLEKRSNGEYWVMGDGKRVKREKSTSSK